MKAQEENYDENVDDDQAENSFLRELKK